MYMKKHDVYKYINILPRSDDCQHRKLSTRRWRSFFELEGVQVIASSNALAMNESHESGANNSLLSGSRMVSKIREVCKIYEYIFGILLLLLIVYQTVKQNDSNKKTSKQTKQTNK